MSEITVDKLDAEHSDPVKIERPYMGIMSNKMKWIVGFCGAAFAGLSLSVVPEFYLNYAGMTGSTVLYDTLLGTLGVGLVGLGEGIIRSSLSMRDGMAHGILVGGVSSAIAIGGAALSIATISLTGIGFDPISTYFAAGAVGAVAASKISKSFNATSLLVAIGGLASLAIYSSGVDLSQFVVPEMFEQLEKCPQCIEASFTP